MDIDFNWQMYLDVARALSNLQIQEGLYRQALRQAEKSEGPNSLTAGLILLDLSDCLEAQGKSQLGQDMAERASDILRQYLKHNPTKIKEVTAILN